MSTETNPGQGVADGGLSLEQAASAIGELDGAPRDEGGRFRSPRAAQAPAGDEDYDLEDGVALEGDEEAGEAEFAEDDALDGDEEAGLDDEQPDEQRVTVQIDGQEREVALSELITGYQQNTSYTQKSQALAEERRQVEVEGQRASAERAAYTTLLGNVRDFVASQAPSEEVVNQLMLQDPVEGFRLRAVRDQIMAKAGEFGAAYQSMVQQADQLTAQQLHAEKVAALKALPALIPEWKDPKRMEAERNAVGEAMLKWGFTGDELNQISDPRAMVIARKAMLYDKLLEGRKDKLKPSQKQQQQPRALPAGSKANQQQAGRQRQAQALRDRARQTGRIEDVAALIGLGD